MIYSVAMDRVNLVFFDLDGTLADTAEDVAASLNDAFRRESLPQFSYEQIKSYMGDGIRRLIEKCIGEGQPKSETIVALFREHYAAHLCDRTKLYPGVAEGLHQLQTVTKAVVTNKSEGFSKDLLKRLGVAHHFVAIYGGDTLALRKPDPEPLLELMQRYPVPRERVLMVGDSRVDREAARAAGIAFCGVTYGYHKPGELGDADFCAASFSDVVRIILNS